MHFPHQRYEEEGLKMAIYGGVVGGSLGVEKCVQEKR